MTQPKKRGPVMAARPGSVKRMRSAITCSARRACIVNVQAEAFEQLWIGSERTMDAVRVSAAAFGGVVRNAAKQGLQGAGIHEGLPDEKLAGD